MQLAGMRRPSTGQQRRHALCGTPARGPISVRVERTLLPSKAVPRRRTRRLLECQVHALVPTVLLRFAGIDALERDAKSNPPGGEMRQPGSCRRRRKRLTVVGPDRPRQAVLLEQLDEHRTFSSVG
jgi:hypothetical protein